MSDSAVLITLEGMALAAMCGLFGQAVRIIPGLRKEAQEARDRGTTLSARFSTIELVLSLVYGAAAGVLAGVSMDAWKTGGVDQETAFKLMGAGYIGSDFIAGIIGKLGGVTPVDLNAGPSSGAGAGPVTPPPGHS